MAELFDDEDNLGDMGAEMAQFRVPKGAPTAVQRSIVESFISRFGKRGIAEVILRNGVLVEAVAHAAMAVSTNCGPTLDHLVRQYGLDVNKPIRGPPDEDAWQCGSLLSFACQEGNTNAVRKLIALKADPNLHDAGLECPAIFAAGEQGHIGCLLALLEAGAEVDLQKPSSGNTALHISAQNGHVMGSMLLKSHGADMNRRNWEKVSPLPIAVQNGHASIVALYISWGVDPSQPAHRLAYGPEVLRLAAKIAAGQNRAGDYTRMVLLLGRTPDVPLLRGAPPAVLEALAAANQAEKAGRLREALVRNAAAQQVLGACDASGKVKPIMMAAPRSCQTPWLASGWVQLQEQHLRLRAATLGPKGSNGLTSLWERYPVEEGDPHPPPVQFQVRCSHAGRIWLYGGEYFCHNDTIAERRIDEVWSCDTATRSWTRHKIAARGPGTRAHATGVVFDGALWVFGGYVAPGSCLDTRSPNSVWRLPLDAASETLQWIEVKPNGKGPFPGAHARHTAVAYQGKMWVCGGKKSLDRYSDAGLWSFDFSTHLWCHETANLPKQAHRPGPRGDAFMWAARGGLFVYGGDRDSLTIKPPPGYPDSVMSETIVEMERFDIASKRWAPRMVVGDHPGPLQEVTPLPLFRTGDEEPYCVVFFGGFTHQSPWNAEGGDKRLAAEMCAYCATDEEEKEAQSGWNELYQKRLFRFDPEPECFTNLRVLSGEVAASAQCYIGARLDGAILLGGGYGVTSDPGSSAPRPTDPLCSNVWKAMEDSGATLTKPRPLYDEFVVHLAGADTVVGGNALQDLASGLGPAWALGKPAGLNVDSRVGAAMFHMGCSVPDADFFPIEDGDPLPGSAVPPGEGGKDGVYALSGKRVEVRGAKREALNGREGRLGWWEEDKGRYLVVFDVTAGKPEIKRVAPSALVFAQPPPYPVGTTRKDAEARGGDGEDVQEGKWVVLHSLSSEALNSRVGKCGPFDDSSGRFGVNLFAPKKLVAVRPQNLRVANEDLPALAQAKKDAHEPDSIDKLLQDSMSNAGSPPTPGSHPARFGQAPSVQTIRVDRMGPGTSKELSTYMDKYNGPLSPEAMAVLQCLEVEDPMLRSMKSEAKGSNIFVCFEDRAGALAGKGGDKCENRVVSFRQFLEARDSKRAAVWLADTMAAHGSKEDGSRAAYAAKRKGTYLQLRVKIDGLVPEVWRRLRVSASLTLRELHHQVLCPVMGWTPHYHAYAFRRVHVVPHPPNNKEWNESNSTQDRLRFHQEQLALCATAMRKEMWVGPKASGALDFNHTIFYIGGAVVDDSQVRVLDLLQEEGDAVQWVADLGDWWSHTIEVEEVRGGEEDGIGDWDSSIASVIAGEQNCPPEDQDGVTGYIRLQQQLQGKVSVGAGGDDAGMPGDIKKLLNPTMDKWWDLLNSNILDKNNASSIGMDPFAALDLSAAQLRLEKALRRKLEPVEGMSKFVMSSAHGQFVVGVGSKVKKLLDVEKCAMCGTTARVRECGGCHRVAYCCTEHQQTHWKEHKADCRAAQAEAGAKSNGSKAEAGAKFNGSKAEAGAKFNGSKDEAGAKSNGSKDEAGAKSNGSKAEAGAKSNGSKDEAGAKSNGSEAEADANGSKGAAGGKGNPPGGDPSGENDSGAEGKGKKGGAKKKKR